MNKREVRNLREVSVSSILLFLSPYPLSPSHPSCIIAPAVVTFSRSRSYHVLRRGRYMNLKNAVALVTGGGSGLGEATVREFASAGAKVAILDLPSSPGAKVAESLGADAIFVVADVASADQVADAVAKTIAKFRSIQ